ncbi:superoxide dismutase family protein [Simplicispira psychrophila]|uniref:superoxide dismutase family protein n=1 Tax=Simplicispira psychrophila TaxID=80882 RepID=UPI00068A110E|nr:superoxide dismutase family protein [Simplicispira psychrophila]
MPHTSTSFARVSAIPARRWRGLSSVYGVVAAAVLALSAGCSSPQHSGAADPGYAAPASGATAIGEMPMGHARLLTAEGATAGIAKLQAVQGGVEIVLQVQGMAPGTHGFHIHTQGECAPAPDAKTGKMVTFGAAGGHFDPYSTQTHGHPGQSPHAVHAGDIPNLVVDASGQGTLRYTNTGVTLTPGPHSIAGRSLVVHQSADDYKTNPAGNSGSRIACGVILMTPENQADATPPGGR